jgi:hypothetical protein
VLPRPHTALCLADGKPEGKYTKVTTNSSLYSLFDLASGGGSGGGNEERQQMRCAAKGVDRAAVLPFAGGGFGIRPRFSNVDIFRGNVGLPTAYGLN